MRRAGVKLSALVVFALAAASTAARADYREEYASGLKAASDGKWAEVESRMRAAIAEEAAPQVQTRLYGQRFEPYVPAFFLGIAAARRGDCDDAVRLLTNAPTQVILRDSRAKRRLGDYLPLAAKGLADCETRLAGAANAPATPAPPATPPTTPPATTPSNAPPTAPVASNTTTRPAPSAPPSTSPSASNPPTQPVASTTPAPPATRPAAPPAATASSAPAPLTTALDDFLRGRYQQVAAADPAQLADRRARFHVLLLRAASRHTLALMQGDAGAALLTQAAADVRAAKALDGGAPDAALFSPRFRAFYGETR